MPQQIHPRELADRRAAGERFHLLDVRQPEEHAFARIADSVLIPLPELASRVAEVEPPEGVPVVVYCHHGVRSLSGAAMLERAGVIPVYSLSGGIDAWSALIDPSVPRY
jgi:rhodanese-related sulfurtransferase